MPKPVRDERGTSFPSKAGEREPSVAKPSSRVDDQLLGKQSRARNLGGLKVGRAGSLDDRLGQAVPGVAKASKASSLPTPDDSIFGESFMVQAAKPLSKPVKPGLPRTSSLQPAASRSTAQPVPGKDLSHASTELQSCNVAKSVAEPHASTSLPPGFARSGTPAPTRAAEAPEVQSPMKPGAPLAPEPSGAPHTTSSKSASGAAAALQSDDLELLRRRALESSRRSGGPHQHGKGQKRPRSPSALSRSSSPEKHRHKHAGHGSHRSRPHGRSESRPADPAEQPALARQSSGTQHPGVTLRTASSGGVPAEQPRAMSAREICREMPAHATTAPASTTTIAADGLADAVSQALPAGCSQQGVMTHQAAESSGQIESLQAALEAELQLQLLQSSSHAGVTKPTQPAGSELGGKAASEAGAAAAGTLSARQPVAAAAPAALEKTAKIGAGMSFMDMGSMLEKLSSKDKDVKVCSSPKV